MAKVFKINEVKFFDGGFLARVIIGRNTKGTIIGTFVNGKVDKITDGPARGHDMAAFKKAIDAEYLNQNPKVEVKVVAAADTGKSKTTGVLDRLGKAVADFADKCTPKGAVDDDAMFDDIEKIVAKTDEATDSYLDDVDSLIGAAAPKGPKVVIDVSTLDGFRTVYGNLITDDNILVTQEGQPKWDILKQKMVQGEGSFPFSNIVIATLIGGPAKDMMSYTDGPVFKLMSAIFKESDLRGFCMPCRETHAKSSLPDCFVELSARLRTHMLAVFEDLYKSIYAHAKGEGNLTAEEYARLVEVHRTFSGITGLKAKELLKRLRSIR